MVDFHYTSALILFCSSVTGCLLPFQRKFDVKPIRPLSTGIVFAVALCHLLPDSSQILDTIQVTEWFMAFTRIQGSVGDDGLYEVLPVTETLVCLGVFIMIVIDQCKSRFDTHDKCNINNDDIVVDDVIKFSHG